MSASYLIVRGPSTMKDEGRHCIHGEADSLRHARKLAKRFSRESKGYYSFDVYKKL